jgi:hypothetical protein
MLDVFETQHLWVAFRDKLFYFLTANPGVNVIMATIFGDFLPKIGVFLKANVQNIISKLEVFCIKSFNQILWR